MNITIAWALLFFTACGTLPKKEPKSHEYIGADLVVTRITANTFLVKDTGFYDSNVLIAKMSDGTAVIASSPIETVRTKSMLAWIQRNLNPKKIIAINTHFHADGTGGNEAYQSVNAEIWSSSDTASIYQKRADSMQVGLAKFVRDKNLSELVLKRKNLPATKVFDAKKEWNGLSERKRWS